MVTVGDSHFDTKLPTQERLKMTQWQTIQATKLVIISGRNPVCAIFFIPSEQISQTTGLLEVMAVSTIGLEFQHHAELPQGQAKSVNQESQEKLKN